MCCESKAGMVSVVRNFIGWLFFWRRHYLVSDTHLMMLSVLKQHAVQVFDRCLFTVHCVSLSCLRGPPYIYFSLVSSFRYRILIIWEALIFDLVCYRVLATPLVWAAAFSCGLFWISLACWKTLRTRLVAYIHSWSLSCLCEMESSVDMEGVLELGVKYCSLSLLPEFGIR